jgi:hypothetical protein
MKMVRYGKSAVTVSSAAGVTGFLLKRMDATFFFRIYAPTGEFTDYDIRHDDLEVTISPDALASFYQIGDRRVLDHSPDVLGLESATDEHQS